MTLLSLITQDTLIHNLTQSCFRKVSVVHGMLAAEVKPETLPMKGREVQVHPILSPW